MQNQNWKERHAEVEQAFVNHLNANTENFILKGGTSLFLCYGLTRFSEDIDLDGKNNNVKGKLELRPYIESFCRKTGFTANLKKDTDMVERWMLNYGDPDHHLKIEVSYRGVNNPETNTKTINGIRVYSIDRLAMMKAVAIADRTKIRDFYDICFITNKYWDKLTQGSKEMIRNVFEYKNFEYVQFLLDTQRDELVQADRLADSFLDAYEKAGMAMSPEDRSIAEDIKERNVQQKENTTEPKNPTSSKKKSSKASHVRDY